MKRTAVVWRKSVYKNEFTCSCGAKLADADGTNFEDNVLMEISNFGTYVYCKKCLKSVAYLRYVNLPKDAERLQGNINDYERRKKN